MDTARLAQMSDPVRNPLFHRRWSGPPPDPKRKRPADRGNDQCRAGSGNVCNSSETNNLAPVAQRAIAVAERRAEQMSARSAILAAIGQRDAGLRLAALAGALLEAVQ